MPSAAERRLPTGQCDLVGDPATPLPLRHTGRLLRGALRPCERVAHTSLCRGSGTLQSLQRGDLVDALGIVESGASIVSCEPMAPRSAAVRDSRGSVIR